MSDRWTLLMVADNHGVVGKAGKAFSNHPAHYERVDVVRADEIERLRETLREHMAIVVSLRAQRDSMMEALDLGVAHILGQHDYPAPTQKEVVDEMCAAISWGNAEL